MDAKDRLKLNFDAPQFGSGLSILGLIEIAGLNETRWKGYGAGEEKFDALLLIQFSTSKALD
ncbi:hypothetical protein OAN95_00565 [Alphaproteobacteria bacterium]|nr:hypothetical protein [Alphaproteobacteria bacterium]